MPDIQRARFIFIMSMRRTSIVCRWLKLIRFS